MEHTSKPNPTLHRIGNKRLLPPGELLVGPVENEIVYLDNM